MSDRESFLRAIQASPEDDTLRRVFADWLQEQGEDDRAEFVRVQVELARSPKCRGCDGTGRWDHSGFFDLSPEEIEEYGRPTSSCPLCKKPRESALLAAHAAGWVPGCPRCEGVPYPRYHEPAPEGLPPCSHCSGSGRCPHAFNRGLLTLRCRLSDVMTDRGRCDHPECKDGRWQNWTLWPDCERCGGTGTVPGNWHLTAWGLALRGYDCEAVELVDREPRVGTRNGDPIYWWVHGTDNQDLSDRAVIPDRFWKTGELGEYGQFPTSDDARRSLALAVARWLWAWEPKGAVQ